MNTVAEIDLKAVTANVRLIIDKVSPARLMAVVKADGYGHGVLPVAQASLQAGAQFLGVAHIDEGVTLRENGITVPILVLVTSLGEQAGHFLHHDLDAAIFDLTLAEALALAARKSGKRARVHLKIDTGMGRLGVPWEKAAEFAQQVSRISELDIIGIFTHFATSDWADKTFAQTQLSRFNHVLKQLDGAGIKIPLKHAANSAAILDLPETYFDMVRAGISIYGYYPSDETSRSLQLEPAMTLKSRVVAVKDLAPGDFVGYNLTFKAERQTRIAAVPIGYGDGFRRALSNLAEVLIHGKRHPQVGTISMDTVMVDLGPDSTVKPGDEVILLGTQGEQEISIYELCQKLNTIPYEFTCGISKRVPRVYV